MPSYQLRKFAYKNVPSTPLRELFALTERSRSQINPLTDQLSLQGVYFFKASATIELSKPLANTGAFSISLLLIKN